MLCKTNAGGGGGVNVFAFIMANYPASAVCTATNGVVTLQSMTGNTHPAIFGIPEPLSLPETWTVTATNGLSTKTQTVSITAQYQIETVTITFSLLPIEYQEVEYLESTAGGGQYIDTGFNADASATTEYDIVFMMRTDLTHSVCGLIQQAGGTMYGYCGLLYKEKTAGTQTYDFGFFFGADTEPLYNASGNISLNTKYDVKLNTSTRYLNIDGTDVASTASVTTSYNSHIYLFGNHRIGGYMDTMEGGNTRIYSFIKKNNSTNAKSMELVPCYRRADSVAGMYDMISESFFTNAGSGTFTVGPDV